MKRDWQFYLIGRNETYEVIYFCLVRNKILVEKLIQFRQKKIFSYPHTFFLEGINAQD